MGRLLACCALLSVLGVGADCVAESDDIQAMKTRLDSLEKEVVDLRARVAQQGDTWLNERRAEEVKALVREVISDADTRASLLDEQVTAGWKGGFFIGSADGNYLLRLRGLLMIRHVYSHQNDPPASAPDDNRAGFELARTRYGFFGHVIDPTWQYTLWTGYSSSAGTTLLDVYVKKLLGHGFSVTAGQFKLPFWREWLVSETRLPMIERSLLNTFSGSYSQGVMLGYEVERMHAYFAFTDGLGNLNTPFNTETVDYALTGRIELLLSGSWAQYAEVEGWSGEDFMLVLGVAAHHEQREHGTATAEASITRWTVDVSAKFDRWSLFFAGVGNRQDDAGNVDQFGLLTQVGLFITDDIEAHLRYEWGNSDTTGDEDLSVLTFGLDHHWAHHQVRVSADVGYAFNAVASFWATGNPLAGYRADAPGEEGQIVVRTQLQLSF